MPNSNNNYLAINVNIRVCCLIVLFGIFFILISYFYFDRAIAIACKALDHSAVWTLFHYLTQGGNWKILLCVYLILGLFVFCIPYAKSRRRVYQGWIFGIFLAVISSIITRILKISLGRPRPFIFLAHGIYGFPFLGNIEHNLPTNLYGSFPSGHVQAASAFGISLMLMFPKLRNWIILYIATIMASRVILEKHYVSDVFASVVILATCAMVQFYLIRKIYCVYGGNK